MKFSANAILEDIKLPDYKGRHVFLAKLRVAVFVVFLILGGFYFNTLWQNAPWVPLVISLAFLITGLCYHFILKNQAIFFFFTVELAADLLSMTVMVYLTGGGQSDYFTVYLMYGMAAGIFFNYHVSLMAALLSVLFYGGLNAALFWGWISPFEAKAPAWAEWPLFKEYGRFFFLLLFLPLVVYGMKISNYFSRVKQRTVEARNIQLSSLNRIGSTIRRLLPVEEVIQQVLAGVIEGLGYDVCLLALFNKTQDQVYFYTPKDNELIQSMEALIGFPLGKMSLNPREKNSITTAILRNRVVFRQELSLLVEGVKPAWEEGLAERVQKQFEFKKFIITPLTADRKVIGALIGISCTEFVDENRIDVLENFSNQAALAIESSQLFEELKQKNLELERASRLKSEFLAMMSHELRTPLTAIIGFTELVMEGSMGQLKEEQVGSLKEVIKNANHLLELINGILDLAKIEAGKLELNEDFMSVGDLVDSVHASLKPLMKKKAQSFIAEIDENIPIFYGDNQKVKQVLINLLSNANKFTPEGGQIILKALFEQSRPLLPKSFDHLENSEKGYLRISVKDNGIGIAKSSLQAIFNVFEQVDSSHTRQYSGTGLGLALSKQFVELHRGVLWAESEQGKGAEFVILLPFREPGANTLDETMIL